MTVRVQFFSYFRELTGCGGTEETLRPGATVDDLLVSLRERFPKLESMQRSTLVAVGVEYQPRHHPLRDGDEVSLFPPVQGG